MDVALDMRKFRLPKDIVEYDQWLDKQAEELHKQQALKHSQGVQIGSLPMAIALGMSWHQPERYLRRAIFGFMFDHNCMFWIKLVS